MSNLANLLSTASRSADSTTTNASATSEKSQAGSEQGNQTTQPTGFEDESRVGKEQNTKPLSADSGFFDSESDDDVASKGEPKLIATSLPVQRFKIGRFQFERGTLSLFTDEDVSDFRSLVKQLPPADRNQIKIIDREAAERLVRPIEPGVTSQFDSSVGRQRETLATGDKTVGTDAIDRPTPESFAKQAQTDNNAPVGGTNTIPPGEDKPTDQESSDSK